MLELLRYLAASKRPAAPCMVMGHAGAVGGVQRSEAYILGAALEVAVERSHASVAFHSPTDKEEPRRTLFSSRVARASAP